LKREKSLFFLRKIKHFSKFALSAEDGSRVQNGSQNRWILKSKIVKHALKMSSEIHVVFDSVFGTILHRFWEGLGGLSTALGDEKKGI